MPALDYFSSGTRKSWIALPSLMLMLALMTFVDAKGAAASTTTATAAKFHTFEAWMAHYHPNQKEDAYFSSTQELLKRRRIWYTNQEHVQAHNVAYEAGYTLYAKSMDGPYADLTDAEFQHRYLMTPQDCSATHTSSGRLRPRTVEEEKEDATTSHKKKKPTPTPAPTKKPVAVDWRTRGILTPVKNRVCGGLQQSRLQWRIAVAGLRILEIQWGHGPGRGLSVCGSQQQWNVQVQPWQGQEWLERTRGGRF